MNNQAFPFQIKELSQTGEIVGLAAAFGNVDSGGDRILPGAFAASLAEHRSAGTTPAMLLHHDMQRPIGVWTELAETREGLLAKGRITIDAKDGREAYELARSGALSGLSIGYKVEQERLAATSRDLVKLKLFEISLVAMPMNNLTRLHSVKTIGSVRDIEDLLRSGGLSGRQAKAAASAAWKSVNPTQHDDEAKAVLADAIRRLAKL
ncbi:MAG TPA: HK97 family phage prohead protease [Zoogloea sp.]|nr:HK97 family phage prohead protease [Zoogloea sp.]